MGKRQCYILICFELQSVTYKENYPHLRMFSMHALWLKKAFTIGVPVGTRGALQRKASRAKTLWKDWNSSSPCGRTVMRWQSSVRITRSRIIGLANRESCDMTNNNLDSVE